MRAFGQRGSERCVEIGAAAQDLAVSRRPNLSGFRETFGSEIGVRHPQAVRICHVFHMYTYDRG